MSFDQPLPPFNASDPNASFLSTSCLDFLMIELVPMTYRVANELDAAASASSPVAGEEGGRSSGNAGVDTASNAATATGVGSHWLDEDGERDAVFFRLDGLGYRVGLGLVERYVDLSYFIRTIPYTSASFHALTPIHLPYPHLLSGMDIVIKTNIKANTCEPQLLPRPPAL